MGVRGRLVQAEGRASAKPVWSEGGRECKRNQSQIIQAFESLASGSDQEPLEDSLRFNPRQMDLSPQHTFTEGLLLRILGLEEPQGNQVLILEG